MAKVTPNQVFPGMTIDIEGNFISIPLNVLPGLDATEANPASGDIRPLFLGLLEQLFGQLTRLETDLQPTEFSISKGNPVGVGTNKVRQTYSVILAHSYNASTTEFTAEPEVTVKPNPEI